MTEPTHPLHVGDPLNVSDPGNVNDPVKAGDPVNAGDPVMITVILRHHAGLVLDDIQGRLKAADWWERFPPPGVRIVSWVVAMGFAQIATFELPPNLLPVLNVELERRGWGVFKTEIYPTYDFVPVRERIRERVRQGGQ